MTIELDHAAQGIASVTLEHGRRLIYRCEAESHRISVWDEFGRLVFAFGGPGAGPGALNTPLDVVLVRPEFAGERVPSAGPYAVWLAVADYGNSRVQILELDGAHVATIEIDRRIATGPPCALRWRSPMLEIDGVEGAKTSLHLTAALLSGQRAAGAPVLPPPREWASARSRVH